MYNPHHLLLRTEIFKRVDAAFLFSCFYTFYGYRMIDIYQRSAISESIALTIMPVVLYYTYRLLFEKKNCVIPLAVSMSLLIYTHALFTFMSVIVIGLLFIGSLLAKRKRKKMFWTCLLEWQKLSAGRLF